MRLPLAGSGDSMERGRSVDVIAPVPPGSATLGGAHMSSDLSASMSSDVIDCDFAVGGFDVTSALKLDSLAPSRLNSDVDVEAINSPLRDVTVA